MGEIEERRAFLRDLEAAGRLKLETVHMVGGRGGGGGAGGLGARAAGVGVGGGGRGGGFRAQAGASELYMATGGRPGWRDGTSGRRSRC